MNDTTWIDECVEEHNQRVYNGLMSPRAKKVLREMKLKEHEFWLREQADFIRGFDDGEPQTTVDYNHTYGEE